MKRNSTLLISLFIAMTIQLQLPAQCPGGTTAAELNWDHLDFLPSNNIRYTSFYPSAAFPYTQHFAMGTRSLSMAMSPAANITLNGENGLHTGDAGSFATPGDDVQFTTTAASATMINMNFDIDVANVRFSIFDLDNNQRVNITAVNAGGTAQTIIIANASGFSGITLAGSGTSSATATGPGTDYATTSNRGSINVTIAGPVKQILITMSGAAGDNWLSDLNACITGSFPINYQAVSRPFTGQPNTY